MAKKKADISNAQKISIGVGLTTAAVAAAGAYFLYGSKDASKNRKKVKSWALKAKGEVLEALEKADKMTEDEFRDIVANVIGTYAKMQNVSKSDISEFKKEMAENWQGLVKGGVAKVFNTEQAAKKLVSKKPAKKATVKKAPVKKTAAKKAPAKKATRK